MAKRPRGSVEFQQTERLFASESDVLMMLLKQILRNQRTAFEYVASTTKDVPTRIEFAERVRETDQVLKMEK